ncbi:MAG: hypothetical protein HUK22_02405 [Thermoguttaceae bacterium]|nr:hypothetical protein [Thermoguttaceae bacterium]
MGSGLSLAILTATASAAVLAEDGPTADATPGGLTPVTSKISNAAAVPVNLVNSAGRSETTGEAVGDGEKTKNDFTIRASVA